MTIQRLSHIGICVSELERSVCFYRDVLGFQELCRLQVEGAEAERLLNIDGGELQAVYLERDDTHWWEVVRRELETAIEHLNSDIILLQLQIEPFDKEKN